MNWVVIIGIVAMLLAGLKWYIRNNNSKFVAIKETDTLDERFNATKQNEKIELDLLLDKVSAKGLNALSETQKSRLEYLSAKI